MSQWPTSPAPSSLKLGTVTPTRVSVTQNLKRNVRSVGAQRWKLDLGYTNMTRAQMAPILAFVMALRGQYGSFTFVMPTGSYETAQGSFATPGTIQVDGASQTGRSINLKGFTNSQTGVVKAGDFIKFSDSKVYMATADANSDGSGHSTVSIEPSLIVSPADSETVVYTSIPFTFALAGDAVEIPVRPPLIHDYSVSFVEAY